MSHSNVQNKDKYSSTPLIRKNWDGQPYGYAGNPDNWIFEKKKKVGGGYIGSLKFGYYYLQYVPASKSFDRA